MQGKALATRTYPVRVRWTDFDALRHVNAGRYMTLLEEARDEWLADVLGIVNGEHYVLASIAIDFVLPLTLERRECLVEIVPVRVGRTSIGLQERVLGMEDEVHVTAESVIVLWDPDPERPGTRMVSAAERASIGLDAAASPTPALLNFLPTDDKEIHVQP